MNDLIFDIQRNGLLKGIGKPEPLKYVKAYSRVYISLIWVLKNNPSH
jgi:Txe/YoeB family toxin of Txe-Axe toxin-antitoxin module